MSASREEIEAQLAQAQTKLTDTQRARSASRSNVHQKTASNASSASKPESIPEDTVAGADTGTGRRTSGETRARTGGGGGKATSSTSRSVGRGSPTEQTAEPEEEEEETEDEGDASQPRTNPARTNTTASVQSRAFPTRPQTNTAARNQNSGSTAARENAAIYANVTDTQRALLEELEEINGQDSYDALAVGVGKLKRDEYLRLPRGLVLPRVTPEDVGLPKAHVTLSIKDWANLYALNKAAAPQGVDANMFALIRMEAVKAGWYADQREVTVETPPVDAITTLATDLPGLRDRSTIAKTGAFLLPMIAEHVFRTFGHHFISTDASNYTARYSDTLRSCLVPEVATLLPPAALYHSVLHWVSPARARRVLMAQLTTQQIPDALRIRANAAPAGTAILTTTTAILNAMEQSKLAKPFADLGGFDVELMQRTTEQIKVDPCKYHKSYFAYGVRAPSQAELDIVERAKEEAIRFAPFAQAFINVYMRDAALGKARALQKHADENPIARRRAENLFRAIVRNPVRSVEELFATVITARSDDVAGM